MYHCAVLDRSQPCRPTLEVEAVLREGDADDGPLLLSVAEYVAMAGGPTVAGPCLDQLARRGRIVTHLDVAHLAFPTWTPVDTSGPAPRRAPSR